MTYATHAWRILVLLTCLVILTGRTLTMSAHPGSHRVPPPPPHESEPLTEHEIVEISGLIAQEHGYVKSWIDQMEKDGDHRWTVKINGRKPHHHKIGELKLKLDAWDGRILEIDDKHQSHVLHHKR